MKKQISVYDAFLECLHVLADVSPCERYKVVDALHRMQVSPEGSRVFASEPATEPRECGCTYEDCSADADVSIGASAFCRYHAADGLLSSLNTVERAVLVSLHVTSDEILGVEREASE